MAGFNLKHAFNPLFNENISNGQDSRTASINALCSMFKLTVPRLKEIVEGSMKRASYYNLQKSKATTQFLLHGNKNYDDIMIQIDKDFDLSDIEWFILKEFRECIQSLDFIE